MNKTEEQQLLEGARRYDHVTLAQIYDRYSPGLFSYAIRLIGDVQNSEDCVAETFSRFLSALQRKSGPYEHLQAYLYRIAHNWITDYYRSKPITQLDIDEQVIIDPTGEPNDALEFKISSLIIRESLMQLNPDQRQVIVLRFLHGWDYCDIAAALNKSVGAIKALQHRGLEKLNTLLIDSELKMGV